MFIIEMVQIGTIGGSIVAEFKNMTKPSLLVVTCECIILYIRVIHLYGRNSSCVMAKGEERGVGMGSYKPEMKRKT